MSAKYSAIIIEPRKHKAIEFVLNNVCECLPDDWDIVFFHGKNNVEYVTNIVAKINNLFENRVDRIKLVNLHVDNLDLLSYSELFATKSILYEHIDSDTFLVFQTDSMILKQNKHLLNDFLDYDYVGAPWLITEYIPTKECGFIGNGGFSLRRKSKLLEIISKIDWHSIEPFYLRYEDLYFSKKYENIEFKKPEFQKATTFCVDEVFSEIAFACHKPWCHEHYDSFKNIYPEVEILRNLQSVESE